MKETKPRIEELKRRFQDAGQFQVLRFWDQLSPKGQAEFEMELSRLDLVGLSKVFQSTSKDSLPVQEFKPPERVVPWYSRSRHITSTDAQSVRAILQGRELLRKGRVGCLLVAGGQATRLGITQPKGMLEFGGKTLFQGFADQLLDLRDLYRASIPLYVMTSSATHGETEQFFREKQCFGLPSQDVVLFSQRSIPTFSLDGKLLLRATDRLLDNPDGHGGLLSAASRSGVIQDARRRGIEVFYYFQVDNPLALIADPLFLGHHKQSSSQYSLKTVHKSDPNEKLGMVCQRADGRHCMVEYSELPEEMRNSRTTLPGNPLSFHAGSIAIHAFDLSWFEEMSRDESSLPWHRARKKVKALNSQGNLAEIEGIKFEKFIFDLLPKAPRCLVLETSRELEFAPIKNQSGPDSLETSMAQYQKVKEDWSAHREWILKEKL